MAKGCYIGVDGKARKVKKGYVGVNGVARKIKKAYIGDANGIARLCWESSVPYVVGTKTLSSTASTISITGLNFTPAYVFCFNPSTANNGGTSYYEGMIRDVPNTGGTLWNTYPSQVTSYGENSYADGTLSLTARTGSTNYKFAKGTYYYTVVGEGQDDNIIIGNITTTRYSTSLTIDIGSGKKVVDVKVYLDHPSNSKEYGSGCTYAVNNNTITRAAYDSEVGFIGVTRTTTTKAYTVNNGVLTLTPYSSSYPFYKGTYYYCIVLEDEV